MMDPSTSVRTIAPPRRRETLEPRPLAGLSLLAIQTTVLSLELVNQIENQ
ncbi:hypothetical protein OIU84_026042 [Salix udensis]|uniref:Uncharacterized protein n=1 Tax=Salix udensis TaxID=889485 RepID=A0AAD6KNA4_9ROSI|nr:hypothetical protein OIU84_026042 [Salix udensis]